jgi:catechol 2,3-dioxygenase-like lactoylglutathione lyase family enzyme
MNAAGKAGPPSLGHVGITVPDLDAAIRWYQDVLDFDLLSGPEPLAADESHGGTGASLVFGPKFASGRVAILLAGGGVGIELFEFDRPATERREEPFEYWKTGISHICVIARDIDRVSTRIGENDGAVRVPPREVFPGEPYRWCYCQDPFGTIVELWTHAPAQVMANRGGEP